MPTAKFDWRPLVEALSTLAPVLAEARARRSAQDDLYRGRLEQIASQEKIDARIGNEVRNIATSTPAAERQRAAADYTAAVRKARASGDASMPTTLGGERSRADATALAGQGAAYANRAAGQFARIDAPTRQRALERQSLARAGLDVKRESGRAGSNAYLARLRAENAAQVDPWIRILADLGSRIARGYQRPDELTQSDGLEEIDVLSLPQRLPMPQRIPALRRMPQFPTQGGGY